MAGELQGIAVVGTVDCHAADNQPLCKRYHVRNFPTFKLFTTDPYKHPKTGALDKNPSEYKDAFTIRAMSSAVTGLLPEWHIRRLQALADLKTFLKAHEHKPKVIMFSNKANISALYKAVSMQLMASIAFAEVQQTVSEVADEYGVSDFPTVLVIHAQGNTTYKGDSKAEPLEKFLQEFVVAPSDTSKGGGKGGKGGKADKKGGGGKPKSAPRRTAEEVAVSQLDRLDSQESMWLLAFHGGGTHDACTDAVQLYRDAVEGMNEMVKTGVVALAREEYWQVAEFGGNIMNIAERPCELQLVLLPHGPNKEAQEKYLHYTGPVESKALQDWALAGLPDSFAEDLSRYGFTRFLVESGRTADDVLDNVEGQITNPKIVLLTNKAEAPPMYKALAMNFKDRANLQFGWFKADEEYNKQWVAKIQPPRIPHVVLMYVERVNLNERKVGTGGVRSEHYVGPLKYKDLYDWLTELANILEQELGQEGGEPVGIAHVKDETTFRQHCTDTDAGLCVLAILDSAAHGSNSSAVLLSHRRRFAAVAKSRHDEPLRFAWLDIASLPGHSQRSPLLAKLGLLRSDLPTLVVLGIRHKLGAWGDQMRMAAMAHLDRPADMAFRTPKMNEFIQRVVEGTAKMMVFLEVPNLNGDAGMAYDPSRAPAEEQEEEFDLSDIMSEEVEGGGVKTRAELLEEFEAQQSDGEGISRDDIPHHEDGVGTKIEL